MDQEPRELLLLANYAPDRQESMERFASLIKREMRGRGLRVTMLRPRPFFGRLARRYRYNGLPKWLGYLDKHVVFPRSLKKTERGHREAGTVVHIVDHGNGVYHPYLERIPHLVTVHDFLGVRSASGEFPENRLKWTGRRYQNWILRELTRVPRLVCVSETTRQDVLAFSQLRKERIGLVYNGLNYPYRPMDQEEASDVVRRLLAGKATGPFFLHVGDDKWYKNREGLIRIFENLIGMEPFQDHRLILVGKPLGWRVRELVDEFGLSDRVISMVSPDNEELRAFYSLADALLYPSLAEGFGWPIIEAQACGCPVFTSGRNPMVEVGGEAASYFDPEAPFEAANSVRRAWNDRDRMITAGFENVNRFSTDYMVDGYLREYREVLRRHGVSLPQTRL